MLPQQTPAPQTPQQPVFSLDKIYIKDLSFEVPNAPQIFLNREQPNIELNINFSNSKIDEAVYQTIINITVTAKIKDQTLFLLQVEQAGVFQMRNIAPEQMELLQNIECPNMLFPYVRETITDLTTRGGFLPIVLAPLNFAALYQQKKQAQANDVKKEEVIH